MVIHGKNLLKAKIVYLNSDCIFLIPEDREAEFFHDTKTLSYREFNDKWEKYDIVNHADLLPVIYAEW